MGRPGRGEDSGGFTPKRGRESESGSPPHRIGRCPGCRRRPAVCGSRPGPVRLWWRRVGITPATRVAFPARTVVACSRTQVSAAVSPSLWKYQPAFRGYSRTWMESITFATFATFATVTGHVIGKSRASWVCASVPIRSICRLLLSTRATGCGCGCGRGHGAVGLVEDVAATVAALSATLASSHLFAVTGPSVCSRRRCRCRSCPI